MTIWSLVAKRIEDGGWTGVSRFDALLRRVFPEMRSVTSCPEGLGEDDVVITDNHISLYVPRNIATIVVHHGCAATHYERDSAWQNPRTAAIVRMQREMFWLPNRTYVAPGIWVADKFCFICPLSVRHAPHLIPHWVEAIEPLPKYARPRIIGDWRDHNKGSGIWKSLAARCPQWDFDPLCFQDDAGRRRQYGEASLYLRLSLSEGAGYDVCDAEAASLPIVTTDVGNAYEFPDCEVISWRDRDNLEIVASAIERKLASGRKQDSFYRSYSFDEWKLRWEVVVQVAAEKKDLLVCNL